MKRHTSIKFLVLCAVLVSLLFAEQFTFIDTKTMSYPNTKAHNKLRPDDPEMLPQPANWTTPIDYYGGHIYTRLEIMEKGCNGPRSLVQCWWFNNANWENCELDYYGTKHAGTPFNEVGTYYCRLRDFKDWFKIRRNGNTLWDGTQKIDVNQLTMKSFPIGTGDRVCAGVKMRLEVIITANGSPLKPPEHWDAVDYDACVWPGCGADGKMINPETAMFNDGSVNVHFVPKKTRQTLKIANGRITTPEDVTSISVMSLQGKKVATRQVSETTYTLRPSTAPGMYIATLLNADNTTSTANLIIPEAARTGN